jgi:Domain of Unknown Function (DUF928)
MVKWQYRQFYRATVLSLIVGLQTIPGGSIGLAASPKPVNQSAIQRLSGLFRRDPQKRPRVVRGLSEACFVSPGQVGSVMMWHRRPVFIWEGGGDTIVLKNTTKLTETLWTAPIAAGITNLAYPADRPELVAGVYTWQIIDEKTKKPALLQFGILADEKWQAITKELTAIEQTMKGQSPEDIAAAKAELFAEKKYWSDALQVLYEVENPSTAFIEQRRSAIQQTCDLKEPVKPTTATAQS